jgi:hypothetical protein
VNILLFCEHPRRYAWSHTAWAVDLTHGLRARGHTVTVACDGAEDTSVFAPAEVIQRRPLRDKTERDPLGFYRWTCKLRAAFPHQVSLSVSQLAPADVWLPVGPDEWASYKAAVRAGKLATAGLEAAHRLWLPAAILTERLAARAARAGGARHLLIGSPEAQPRGPSPTRAGHRPQTRPGPQVIGYASRLERPDDAALGGLRARTRGLLAIPEHRLVILLSAAHPRGRGVEPLLEAVADLERRREGWSPLLLVAGHRAYTVHEAAHRLGCARCVRTLGATARMEAALAACDLAAAPDRAAGEGDTGRFIADALRLGRPVLADRLAPGAELLLPRAAAGNQILPGMVVESRGGGAWVRALQQAMRPEWRAQAAEAARVAGDGLGIADWVGRVERVLLESAAHRAAPAHATLRR